MELSLVLTALRRRWWLILLCTVVGGLVGSIYAPAGESNYESRTVLLVSPPADSAISAQSDPDRFVIGQLDILRSNTLADEVREAASDEVAGPSGGQLTTADVAGALTVSQVPKTDIVNLAIAWPDPESAQLLAQHYADTYLENLTGSWLRPSSPASTGFSSTTERSGSGITPGKACPASRSSIL